MKRVNDWHDNLKINKTVEALKKNSFDASYFATKEEAVAYITQHITEDMNVGFAGSMTVDSLGIKEIVESKGATIIDHMIKGISKEEKFEIMRAELMSDVFICGSNAVTLDGKLINVDAIGNRVGAISFGPRKVIIVMGTNKICIDEEDALRRVKNEAAPKNAERLQLPTPCTKAGQCMECKSDNRICRVYSVIKKKPLYTDIEIVLINSSMGF